MLTRSKSSGGSTTISYDTLNTTEQKYSLEKCRVCLHDGQIPIFGVNDLSEAVMEFGNIEVCKDDNLPQYLCEGCYSLLEAAILFRKTAKLADEQLRNLEYLDSASVVSGHTGCKNKTEPFIKREYLEFTNTSDSEVEDFDMIKHHSDPEHESMTYPSISNADTQEINSNEDYKDVQLKMEEEVKEEEGNCADNEMIMIIVSDKDKLQQPQPGCEKFNITFETVADLALHNEKQLPKAVFDERECEICHKLIKRSSHATHLEEHRKKYKEKHEKKYAKVECEICGKKISKSYIKYHLKLHGTAEEQNERLIECPVCKKTLNINYYQAHMKRVHDKKNKRDIHSNQIVKPEETPLIVSKFNKCPVCDKKIKESEYKLHLTKHGGSLRRYICDKCGKVFKYPSAFKTHCLIHGSELKYKCQFCPYRGLHQGLLKIHVRTHTGDYNYKCTECPAQFITKSNLSKHIQRHKGICSYKCEICNKGFYSKRDVDKHNKNFHLNIKNHVCDTCGKAFAHRDNMLSHQRKVHNREKFISRGRIPSYLKEQVDLST